MDDQIYKTVKKENVGERLDAFLKKEFSDRSRSYLQRQIKDGVVRVNEETTKPNAKLKLGDVVGIRFPQVQEYEVKKQNIPLEIVYQDKDIAVINKPSGMVVHPAAGNWENTLVNALMYHIDDLSGINGVLRPGIIHRIDKDTSGLLLVAKNDAAHKELAKDLKERTIKRKYLCIVSGVLSEEEGTVDAPIGRDPKNRLRMAVTEKNAKRAVTHFIVRERFLKHTLLEASLETGRTHQIRVHLSYIGHPIVGDPLYGPKKQAYTKHGQALHAYSLEFLHPQTKEEMRFTVETPAEFNDILKNIKNSRS
ncbi:MAG TPA: RNA pseudouridine synthase [Eubacteriaceae bacterium]|nr:RNA pseudouridine synthase [Eubacteriaceae bacterium]